MLTYDLSIEGIFQDIPDKDGNRNAQAIRPRDDLFSQILGNAGTQIFFLSLHRGSPGPFPHHARLLSSELSHLPREILHKILPSSHDRCDG